MEVLACINRVSVSVQSKLNTIGIITRPNAESGAWLSLLLPAALILGSTTTPGVTQEYQRTGVFCIGLLTTAILCIYNIIKYEPSSHSSFVRNKIIFIPIVLTGLCLFLLVPSSIFVCLFGCLLCSFPYLLGVMQILIACPKCLTFGEASVIVQAVLLLIFSATNQLYERGDTTPRLCMDITSTILEVGLLGIGFICGLVYKFPALRSTIPFYAVSGAIVSGIILVLHVLLQQSPVLWILHFLFADSMQRFFLMVYWFTCSGIAFWAVSSQIQGMKKASTIVRKYLHILAVAVFLPGLIQDCCLLLLASGIILALFIMLEMFRVLSLPPLGDVLQDGFVVYADEKDEGGLALTPIYLLAGCSLPLWLHPSANSAESLLPLLSGLLSIGVGDTAASAFGTWFGKHRWTGGTRKTKEGTVACILSQLFVIQTLMVFGYIDCSVMLIGRSLIATIITSLVEAKTDQVDNLVLPLVMYILLV